MIVSSEKIEIEILTKYHDYLVSLDYVLSKIRSMKTIHGGGFQYEIKGKYNYSPIQEISSTIEMKYDDILNYNIEKFSEGIYNLINNQLDAIHRMMYQEISNATTNTGNVVDARGKGFSVDLLLDMLDKIELTFDEDGSPILPQIHMHPDAWEKTKDLQFSPEQTKRQAEIIKKKKEEWYAKKRYRKLSYIN